MTQLMKKSFMGKINDIVQLSETFEYDVYLFLRFCVFKITYSSTSLFIFYITRITSPLLISFFQENIQQNVKLY